jgi:hypothetical protein
LRKECPVKGEKLFSVMHKPKSVNGKDDRLP